MRGTVLLYASHDRCNLIHNDLIAQRALRGRANRRVLFLTGSVADLNEQRASWETFRWFFDFYKPYGLEAMPFFWTDELKASDAELLFEQLESSEVVILGGGSSKTGLRRYKDLGARFGADAGRFGRILLDRQRRGLLTVGFSAGADQLSQYLFKRTFNPPVDTDAFALARNVMTFLHSDPSKLDMLKLAAERFPECMVFALPNDSALYLDQGVLDSGEKWQRIDFVIDNSWDKPEDAWHLKTRQGALIDHFYSDGRTWAFRGDHRMLRLESADGGERRAWIETDGGVYEYWTQQPSDRYESFEEILAARGR